MTDQTKQFTTGQCLCGQVKYSVSADPLLQAQCHCKQCQRMSGGGHMNLAFFPEDAVSFEGKIGLHEFEADSGNTKTRHFCPECGVGLFGTNTARPGMISVSVGTSDNNSWFSPAVVVHAVDRPEWDMTSTDVPNFDAMPPEPK